MLGVAALLLLTTQGSAQDGRRFKFAVLGCMPYAAEDYAAYERLIAEINRQAPAFSVHLGDIKKGKEPPTEEMLTRNLAWFDSFAGPLVYTPGDNEWTDVHQESNGRQEPLVWLAKLRRTFFATERSLGAAPLPLQTQRSQVEHAAYVENARWIHEHVVFATVHVVGSSNGDIGEVPGLREEFLARDAANTAWLRATFAEAVRLGAAGVAIFCQAQPLAETAGRAGFDRGYRNFLETLEAEARSFGRPVLLVHADEHRYRLDSAVRIAREREPVPNLTRFGVFGENDVHAGVVLVDPASEAVFLCGPLLVPDNKLPALPSRKKIP